MSDNGPLIRAMDEIAAINEKGGKGTEDLKGKTYTKVATRVEIFRKHLGESYGIETAPLFPAQGGLFMQAWIKDKDGFILGAGHAYTNLVSKDKGAEKLETVAVGRALASIGLAGGEYASDAEMNSWADRYEERREFSFTKKDLDELIGIIEACETPPELDSAKARARAEKENMTPNHIARVRGAITAKETELSNRELDEGFQAKGV